MPYWQKTHKVWRTTTEQESDGTHLLHLGLLVWNVQYCDWHYESTTAGIYVGNWRFHLADQLQIINQDILTNILAYICNVTH